jgi:hypothetical protein
MQVLLTEKRKFNYVVLASLMTFIALWVMKIYNDGSGWPF